MKKIAIHQFSPTANYGDGVTNGMLYMQKILQELGFDSNIYAERYDEKLEGQILSYKQIDKEDLNQLLFVHYSIFYDFSAWMDALPIKKHMIYHNITPAEFFKDNPHLYKMCKDGREILPLLKEKFDGYIGDSDLNSQELLNLGYKDVKTIPLLIDVNKKVSHPFDTHYFDQISQDFSIMFVGRIAPNKAQHDLVKIAKEYKKYNNDFKFYIIGGTTDKTYENRLREEILESDLEENVILTGKISDEKLYAHYRASDAFVCMSEHEGFGIPLVEAMLFGVPVIAFNSSNIKSTLNGGGILFEEKRYEYIAATISLIRTNRAFRRAILLTQDEATKIYTHTNVTQKLAAYLNSFSVSASTQICEIEKEVRYQIEGPFDSSYSLALLNREMAKALEILEPKSVALFSTEGGGDFEPNKTFLQKHSLYETLHKRAKKAYHGKVVLRNLYPPRVRDAKGIINLMNSYGWEESAFPREYIQDFNTHLDALPVMSSYVQKLMRDNGLSIPSKVVGVGVDHLLHVEPKEYKLQTKKSFKFLHISSCFPRKGVDVLLQSYEAAFTKEDDVSLIIKTFPNPHNNIQELLKTHQKQNPNFPEVELINQDLEDSYLIDLYKKCDTLVAPSRGEGFGLPMAEAMLFELPVITTGYGGQCDFCTDESAWLIDYSFAKAKTHMNLFNSFWVEPSSVRLSELMRKLFTMSKQEKAQKTAKAKELILANFRWHHCATKILETIVEVQERPIFENKTLNLGWISSYNTKCGIATYSEFLLRHFPSEKFHVKVLANYSQDLIDDDKEHNVIRCWGNRKDKDIEALKEQIDKSDFEALLINFNFAFFSMQHLQELLEYAALKAIKVSIVFHSVKDVEIEGLESSLGWISQTLQKIDHIFVHNIEDLNILKTFNLVQNVTLFPHGVQNRDYKQKEQTKNKVIASYGFMLPHKGIKELIEAFAVVYKNQKNIELLLVNALYPDPISDQYAQECEEKIKELGVSQSVTMITDFLSDDTSLKHLEMADILVMPYKQTQESSSAAVRYAISTNRPVVCTPISIFNDVADVVHFFKDTSVTSMATKLEELLQNEENLYAKSEVQKSWIKEHDWKEISKRLQEIISH